jgi:hypothetical protein
MGWIRKERLIWTECLWSRSAQLQNILPSDTILLPPVWEHCTGIHIAVSLLYEYLHLVHTKSRSNSIVLVTTLWHIWREDRVSTSGGGWNYFFSTASRQDLGLTQQFRYKQTHTFIPYEYVKVDGSLYQYYVGRGVIFDLTNVSRINSAVISLSGD